MSLLNGVSYSGLRGMVERLRWADTEMRRLGHRHYVFLWMPAKDTATWTDVPLDDSGTAAAPLNERPPRWASFSDFADDLRALDASLRKTAQAVHLHVLFPFPSGRRGTRRHRNALAQATHKPAAGATP